MTHLPTYSGYALFLGACRANFVRQGRTRTAARRTQAHTRFKRYGIP